MARKPFDWKLRHLVVIIFSVIMVYGFLELRGQWSPMHKWNRAVGDASFVLVAFSMAIGPWSRIWAKTKRLIPWRREFGIYGVILAFVHAAIILIGWMQWDLYRLIGMEWHPGLERYVMFQHGLGLANLIGIAALFYALVLGLTSNNFSQRILGNSVWKFVQQGTYILWWMIVIHTAYFLFMHFNDFHRATPEPNQLRWVFVYLVLAVSVAQLAASIETWKRRKSSTTVAAE